MKRIINFKKLIYFKRKIYFYLRASDTFEDSLITK